MSPKNCSPLQSPLLSKSPMVSHQLKNGWGDYYPAPLRKGVDADRVCSPVPTRSAPSRARADGDVLGNSNGTDDAPRGYVELS